MKKAIFGFAAIALLAACGGGSGPENTATSYLTALKDQKWDDAIALGTEETKANIEFMKTSGNSPVTDVKDLKCEVANDTTATCSFCCDAENAASDIQLVKRGDKWLVNDPKEMDMGGEGDDMLGDIEEELTNTMDSAMTEIEGAMEGEGEEASAE
jgi:hypothetical protein